MTRIGEAVTRPEGPQKVAGRASYAADHNRPNQLHAVFVGAPVAAGTLRGVNAEAASALPGVVRVLTREDMPRFGEVSAPAATGILPMQDAEIRHEGQPVAIVLAETLEAAQEGAALVAVDVARAAPTLPGDEGVTPELGFYANEEGDRLDKGDVEVGLASAATRFARVYNQPSRHNNPMEPSATVAEWNGDKLTMWDATQHGYSVPQVVGPALGVDPENIRIVCPHTGGGFGLKGYVWPHQTLTAAAARIMGRPVKMVLTRPQLYGQLGYQPRLAHDLTLGVDEGGALTAIDYTATNATCMDEDFVERATYAARQMYASPNIRLRQEVSRANTPMPTAMRAPVEGPGTWAIESALDELADQLGMDPLDLRLASYPEVRPSDDKAWSSIKLREAYEWGAEAFGWRDRASLPRTDGNWRIGRGMASCCMGSFRFPAKAEVILRRDGTAVVSTGTHDIGSGTTTIFPQVAADVLGLPMDRVEMRWGDTRLPAAGPTYGSSSTMGVGGAVMRAAQDARAKLARQVNVAAGDLDVAEALSRMEASEIVGDGDFTLNGMEFEEGGASGDKAMATFGAVFVEVGVDPELGLLRLRRAVGSYSAGRIINAMTARHQMTGGMIWGWGMAAMEQSIHEPTHGRFLHKNLSSVHVPVNADIPSDLTVHFVDEVDEYASPLGGKGIGELGATGVAAAVANAVHDAIGVRVRELPITPDKLVA